MDTPNKSARFCSNILGDTPLQSLKSEKTQKISLVPIPRHENLADLFLILPGQLQMSSKRFHLYSFIKLSKNKAKENSRGRPIHNSTWNADLIRRLRDMRRMILTLIVITTNLTKKDTFKITLSFVLRLLQSYKGDTSNFTS